MAKGSVKFLDHTLLIHEFEKKNGFQSEFFCIRACILLLNCCLSFPNLIFWQWSQRDFNGRQLRPQKISLKTGDRHGGSSKEGAFPPHYPTVLLLSAVFRTIFSVFKNSFPNIHFTATFQKGKSPATQICWCCQADLPLLSLLQPWKPAGEYW